MPAGREEFGTWEGFEAPPGRWTPWAALGSMKFAVVLLLLFGLSFVAASVIPQDLSAGAYRRRYGAAAEMLGSLGLTHIFRSPGFEALMGVTGLGLIVCSGRRAGLLWQRTYRPVTVVPAELLAQMPIRAEWETPADPAAASERLAAALRRKRYRAFCRGGRPESPEVAAGGRAKPSDYWIYAHRGAAGDWGAFIAHLSVLVVFVGAVYGHLPAVSLGRLKLSGTRAYRAAPALAAGEQFAVSSAGGGFVVAVTEVDEAPGRPAVALRLESGERPAVDSRMSVDRPLVYRGTRVVLRGVASGRARLVIWREPGRWLVWSGGALLLAGLFLSCYVTHRTIRARLWREGDRTRVLVGGASRGPGADPGEQVNALREEMAEA
jgi:cytochrome c biogenesis protein ResB